MVTRHLGTTLNRWRFFFLFSTRVVSFFSRPTCRVIAKPIAGAFFCLFFVFASQRTRFSTKASATALGSQGSLLVVTRGVEDGYVGVAPLGSAVLEESFLGIQLPDQRGGGVRV